MVNVIRSLAAVLFMVGQFTAGSAFSADAVRCTECGMAVDMNSVYTARTIQADKTSYFCDIGDLFSYLNKKGIKDGRIEVRDNATGEWLDAHTASYVHAERHFHTPMGWGIAAFKDKNRAAGFGEVMDFAAAAKSVK